MFANFLAAGFNIAFHHYAFNKLSYIGVHGTAMENIFNNSYLFHVFLVGITMVAVNNCSGMLQIMFCIKFI